MEPYSLYSGAWPEVVYYKRNRVSFGTQPGRYCYIRHHVRVGTNMTSGRYTGFLCAIHSAVNLLEDEKSVSAL